MTKGLNGAAPIPPQHYEPGPPELYLEANNYYMIKDENAYLPSGRMIARAMTYINENLGLEVVIVWPQKTAMVVVSGAGPITQAMCSLYERVDILEAFLIDAAALRKSKMPQPNHNN